MNAQEIIDLYKLEKHPSAGFFKIVYESNIRVKPLSGFDGGRAVCSTIYYLLQSNEKSDWHKMKQDELWFYHAGNTAIIQINEGNGLISSKIIGNKCIDINAEPQVIIPARHSFRVELLNNNSFIFVSCVTTPGFEIGDASTT